MDPTDDNALLRLYAESGSDEAFATLVSRHVNLVYSVALRQVGNPHQAEEITQAVFITLARKAGRLRVVTSLSSWLFETTRLTAHNYVRSEIRRCCRDHEAHMQSTLNESGDEIWPKIAPLLDTAVAALGEKDRRAVVLRFYEGRNHREIAQALGASEDAAEKRVERALEKLQRFFRKQGIDSTTAALGAVIATNCVHAAPTALAQTAAAAAVAKAAADSSVLTLAKAALVTMKTKTVIATITSAAIILGVGTYFFLAPSTSPPPAASSETLPVKLGNEKFAAANYYIEVMAILNQKGPAYAALASSAHPDDRFANDVDPNTRRTANSSPAGHIKSLVTPSASGAADYLASISASGAKPLQSARYIDYDVAKNSALLGKRIRASGWIKTKDVANWAGASLIIFNDKGHIFASDPMTDRPIHGTTDWRQFEIVTDVPSEPCSICLGPMLYGTGELWADDFQMAVASRDTPITDDRIWHVWSSNPNDYSETTDYLATHNGHPTLCISYTPDGAAPKGSWMWWGQDIRNPEKYRGHTVRMSGWLKSENISGRIHPNLRPKGPNFKLLAKDTLVNSSRLKGTLDWTKYSLECVIPKETQCLDTGFAFNGSGKLWIDMDSLKYEIVK
jgi:RNA polymerase sigma factor (sigma-70 family)